MLYKAKGSITTVQQYNQWLDDVDFQKFADFDIWRGDESEYSIFYKALSYELQTSIF